MAHQIEGAKGAGAANSGLGVNPIKVAGVYSATPPGLATGTFGDLQVDVRGNLRVTVIPLDGTSACTSTVITLRSASTSSASTAISYTLNNPLTGMIVYFNIASFPGSASTTLALKIRATDPVTGTFSTLLNCAARSATGTTMMMIGPGISASALGVAALLPRVLSFLVSQSSGATSADVVFSIGLNFTP